jgi:hypothetical protein
MSLSWHAVHCSVQGADVFNSTRAWGGRVARRRLLHRMEWIETKVAVRDEEDICALLCSSIFYKPAIVLVLFAEMFLNILHKTPDVPTTLEISDNNNMLVK